MTVRQASGRGIIDWSSFSIGAGGKVLFLNGAGATLNRVTGSQMSLLLGSLQSTGSVYLINPHGVLIGPRGRIKTGGDFVASTLDLSNSSFLTGGALVFDGNSKAFVKNLGAISTTGGSIFLIAKDVSNNGTLSAANGSVGLGAGKEVLLKDSGSDQRVFVQAAGGDVANSGAIAAAQVELRAKGGNIYALAGNDGGQISATGTATRNGQVWLVADGGTAKVSGSISARNADGRGGSIETSGHTVDFSQASIQTGLGGSWLVDPVDLTIDSSAASTIQTALNGGTNVTESTDATGSSGYGTTASGNGDIDVASSISWNSAASLTLSAYRNINIENGVTVANAGAGSLTLRADNAATGTGTVIFNGTGAVNFTGSGNVDLFYHPTTYPTATSFTAVTKGTGTFTPYMTVDTATDLQNINSNLSGNYALNTNIDAGSIANFLPIAHGSDFSNSAAGFSGIFDGQGHTISNVVVNDSTDAGTGLFAQTSTTGKIRNVGVVNVSVNGTSGSFPIVGGLVGENYGNITGSYVTGTVSAGGTSQPFLGGLVGENDGQISNSYSSASVMITKNINYSATVGGLVGDNGFNNATASIGTSLATGSVSTTGSGVAPTIGGFVGENDATISSSYFDSQSTGQSVDDGFQNGIGSATGETTATLQNGTLPSGFSSSIWTASAGSYPKLAWQPPPGISVSGTVYSGTTPLGSITVDGLANGTSFGTTTTNGSGAYTLTAPAGTTSVLTYLTGGYTGNTFSDNGTTSFTDVDVYTNTLRLINVTNNNYSGMISALSAALGGNSGSNFLFTVSGGNLTLGSGANFAVISSVATAIDQSITGTETVLIQSFGNLTINVSKTISATGTGTPLTLVSGGKFTNNAGVNALSTSGGGRWLVYSQNPANDTVGSLSYGFKQYNATYGSTTVAQSTGNGVLYSTAPVITPSLTGSISKTYDGSNTATITSANLTSIGSLSGDTINLNWTGATYAGKNAGAETVTATGLSASATDGTGAAVYGYRLTSTSASGNIGTINAATLAYTANAASRTYGSANPALSGIVTGFVGGDTQASATTGTLAFTSPATTASNVGSYAINGSGLTANNGNYTFQQAAGNATALTINPAVLSYTANTASRSYGSANPAFSGTVTGFVNGDTQGTTTTGTLAFTSPATTASDVGSYAINGSGLTATDGNYTFQQAVGNATALTINPADLSYTANAASRSYGSANPAFSGTVTGFVNGDTQASATTGTLAFTSPATTASNVGSYAINGSGLTANGNYMLQQAAGNATAFTIDPAVLTYTANAASRSYGSANPAFSGTVTGFVNGDTQATATTGTLSFASSATTASSVGNYAINGSGLTANSGNYTLQQAAGNATAFTIDPAVLTYTANAASRTYGSANPVFSGTVAGFVNSDTQASATTGTLVFASPAIASSNVGSYAINGSGLTANNGNYTFQQAAGNATALTINPAMLKYTANAVSRSYGSANPAFSGTTTGFVNGDTQATATTGTLSFSSLATTTSDVGSYAVDGSGLTANSSNYTFQQAAGNATALTINPAVLTYTANPASRIYGSANPAFSGDINGLVNNDTLATVTTGTPSFSSLATSSSSTGTYPIDGSGLAVTNSNYTLQQAPANASALTITPALLTASIIANDKIYDATTSTTGQISALSGILNHDNVSLNTTNAAYRFADKTVGTGKAVFETGAILTGADAGDYALSVSSGSASITPANITASVLANSKTYDATASTAGALGGLSGILGHDTVSLNTARATYSFANPAAGTNKTVTEAGAILTGADAANYRLIVQPGFANINPVPVTVSIANATSVLGAPNPPFSATYTGPPIPGVDIPTLLATLSFHTNASPVAATPGTYIISATANDPNVALTAFPGTLTVLFADTPQVDPALTTNKQPAFPPPLSVAALSLTLAPSIMSNFQITYSADWAPTENLHHVLASFSFLNTGKVSVTNYLGAVRLW